MAGFEFKTGIVAGALVEHVFTPSFSVGMEALYMQKGSRVAYSSSTDTQGSVGDNLTRIELSYLELPLIFKASVPPSLHRASPYVFVGPSMGFRIGARERLAGPWGYDRDVSDVVRPHDWGATGGVGVNLYETPLRWSFEVRYMQSFQTADRNFPKGPRNEGLIVSTSIAR